MTVKPLEREPRSSWDHEFPITTILDPRFPQPGRYSEYGVPDVLRPAVDTLYEALIHSPESSPDESVVESALLRLLRPWSKMSA
jgi:hypothetical protein